MSYLFLLLLRSLIHPFRSYRFGGSDGGGINGHQSLMSENGKVASITVFVMHILFVGSMIVSNNDSHIGTLGNIRSVNTFMKNSDIGRQSFLN